MALRVNFFQTTRGNLPVKEFTEEQDKPTYAKLIHAIELLETDGPYLKPPHVKKLQNKLFELRISGKVAMRIFYTIRNNEYYLLHVFKKKSQKIPLKELKTAFDRIKEVV